MNHNYAFTAPDLTILDCADPELPQIIFPDIEIDNAVNNVFAFGDVLWTFEQNDQRYLVSYDISDPLHPQFSGRIELEYRPGKIEITEQILYITSFEAGPEAIYIYDVSNVAEPQEIACIDSLAYVRDIFLDEDLLIAVGAEEEGECGLRYYDVSDPANPELIHVFEAEGTATYVNENITYLADGNTLKIYDTADFEQIELIGEIESNGHDPILSGVGDLLFCARYSGVRIYNISEPENPQLVFSHPFWLPNKLCLDGGLLYVSGSNEGLEIIAIDITDPDNPLRIGSFSDCEALSTDFLIDGNNLIEVGHPTVTTEYETFLGGWIRVFDISDVSTPRYFVRQNLGDLPPREIYLHHGVASMTDNEGDCAGFVNVNMSDLDNIENLGSLDIHTSSMAGNSDIIFVDSFGTIRSIDNSDPRNPELVGELEYHNHPNSLQMYINGSLLFLTTSQQIYLIDISNISQMEVIRTIELDIDRSVCSEDYLYVAHSDTLVSIIDISDLGSLQVITEMVFEENIREIAINDNNLVVSDENSLFAYDVSDSENPVLVGFTHECNFPSNLLVWNDLIFCNENYRTCLSIYQLSRNEVSRKVDPDMQFELMNIYPNPFNSTTTIGYILPYASDITLSLYNLSGQRIETLVNGRRQAGIHQVTLNACNTPSGLYFVKLEGVGRSVAQKVMLAK